MASLRELLSCHRGKKRLPARLRYAALLCLVAITACNGMENQPKKEPLDPSTFYPDGMSARPIMPYTVARGQLDDDELFYTGLENGAPAEQFPFTVTDEVVVRGQERYNIFCTPCHGYAGYGDGMIVQRGLTPPPSFHSERMRLAPVGHFFGVITNGFGAMYSYGERIPPDDRWAIIAYVRALQLSQNATMDDVPADEVPALEASTDSFTATVPASSTQEPTSTETVTSTDVVSETEGVTQTETVTE